VALCHLRHQKNAIKVPQIQKISRGRGKGKNILFTPTTSAPTPVPSTLWRCATFVTTRTQSRCYLFPVYKSSTLATPSRCPE
jgi:hypothetical protein